MRTNRIVIMDVVIDQPAEFPWRPVLIWIYLFRFQAAEPAFNQNIISPATFPVHTLADMQIPQEILVFVTGKLAALIRIQNRGLAV